MSLADKVSDLEIEAAVLMLDPVVQDLASRTADLSDRAVNSPEFREALREVANSRGVADCAMAALVTAVNQLHAIAGISPTRIDDRAAMAAVDTVTAGECDYECACVLAQHLSEIEDCIDVLDERIAAIRHLTDLPHLWEDPEEGRHAIRNAFTALSKHPAPPQHDECACDADEWYDRLVYVQEMRRRQLVRIWKVLHQQDAWIDPRDGVGMVRAITLELRTKAMAVLTVSVDPRYL